MSLRLRSIGAVSVAGGVLLALVAVGPAQADTSATTNVAGDLFAGSTTDVETSFTVDIPTPVQDLPDTVGIRITPASGSTGSVLIASATGNPSIGPCTVATPATRVSCDWPTPSEGDTGSVDLVLQASADASGDFLYEVARNTAGGVGGVISSQTISIAPSVTGSLTPATTSGTAGQPIGFTADAATGSGAVAPNLPTRFGLRWTGGTGAVTAVPGATTGLSGCAATAAQLECAWAATAGSSARLPATLAFSASATWTVEAYIVDGNGVARVLASSTATVVPAATTPAPGSPTLAATGTTTIVPGVTLAAILLLGGSVLLLLSRRRRVPIHRAR